MKGKFITLVLTLGFLAAFGVFMHSPPSILDGLTGATPKAKRAAQMAAPLEGNYLFCINPALEPFSDADFRNDLKAFVSGETEVLSDAGLPHMTLSVCETDYPLLCYATALCERLTAAGADLTNYLRFSWSRCHVEAVQRNHAAFPCNQWAVSTAAGFGKYA